MSLTDVVDWMNDFDGDNFVWYIKRLSGNDTLANGTHQAGPYIPKNVLFLVFPELNKPSHRNPDIWFDICIDSHSDVKRVRAVWYNNKLDGGTRNECRITNWGGQASALLDPESTGALAVFAFLLSDGIPSKKCRVWVCRHETEEDIIEERVGTVPPGQWTIWTASQQLHAIRRSRSRGTDRSCWLEGEDVPTEWITGFPSGAEIVKKTLELRPGHGMSVDSRLLKRHECEFEIFRSIEDRIEHPDISAGFSTVDAFIVKANSVLQRRKARAGRSLELHVKEILNEEQFQEGVHYEYQPESESGRNPDFLFPTGAAYKLQSFPAHKLRMLAVKTTCRDRWRQVLNEADRISVKHLLTLQQGVSEKQFNEMYQAGVRLVVPSPLINKFPQSIRPELKTLEDFLGELRLLH